MVKNYNRRRIRKILEEFKESHFNENNPEDRKYQLLFQASQEPNESKAIEFLFKELNK
jgi:hypothetical protein